MATNLTTMTPVQIDTTLYANYVSQAEVQARIVSQVKTIEHYEKRFAAHYTEELRKLVLDAREHLTQLQSERSDLIARSTPYHVEYSRRPWNRYYLVDNTNGHVHRGMNCSTCFPTTVYQWLVDLADCDEDAMIEEWGEMACTVCFPEAPSNPNYNRPSRRDREAREAREAEKAARDAAKAEKSITDVDGTPLKDHSGYVLKTKVAARNDLSQCIQNVVWYGNPDYSAHALHLARALQAVGFDWLPSAERALKKVVKEATAPAEPRYTAHLTEEQLSERQAELAVNISTAESLITSLKEVSNG